MTVHRLVRRARLTGLSDKGDICGLLFDGAKSVRACQAFLEWLREQSGECTRREFSQFTRDLQEGRVLRGFTYRRNVFYGIIRRRLMDMGFLALESRFVPSGSKSVLKYVPVRQPIPTWRGPPGQTFYRLAWEICKKWNGEWER